MIQPSALRNPQELGNGLTLRWSTAEDTEKIADLMSIVWRGGADRPPNPRIQDQIRLHMRGDFPWMRPTDVVLVEDGQKAERPVVACGALWRKQWVYGDIPFAVGQPESIATHPDYRNRGLVRAIMGLLHARSEAESHLVQLISGIPNFYRQFGYEYALDLGGKRVTYLALIPKRAEQACEPYRLRPATIADIGLMAELDQRRQRTKAIWPQVTEDAWRYAVTVWEEIEQGRIAAAISGVHDRLLMIIDAAGQPCGYLQVTTKRWGVDLPVYALEVVPGVNLHAVMPALLRALVQYGEQLPTVQPNAEPLREIAFVLGRSHPVYEALGTQLAVANEPPYAWYVRVPDLAAFVRHIAPVLERRLLTSLLANYTGELRISFYRGGVRLAFVQGKLTAAEPWTMTLAGPPEHVALPSLLFLQLLFGYRSLAELQAFYPDVHARDEAKVALPILFPKQ